MPQCPQVGWTIKAVNGKILSAEPQKASEEFLEAIKRCLSGSGTKLWMCRLWPGPQQSGSIALIYNLKILDIKEITRRKCAMAQGRVARQLASFMFPEMDFGLSCDLYQSRGTYTDCAC